MVAGSSGNVRDCSDFHGPKLQDWSQSPFASKDSKQEWHLEASFSLVHIVRACESLDTKDVVSIMNPRLPCGSKIPDDAGTVGICSRLRVAARCNMQSENVSYVMLMTIGTDIVVRGHSKAVFALSCIAC